MKTIILLTIGTTFSLASFAQGITYGAAAGAGVYSMRGDAINNLQQVLNFTNGIAATKPVTGYYAGGYVNIPAGNNFSIEPGLYYSSKGYQVSGTYSVKGIDILSASANSALHSSYIDIPVLLKANLNGLQVFAGPQASYLMSAKLNTTAGIAGFSLLNSKMDVSNQFNRWDIGFTGGLGYQFSNGMRITVAYERGLSKVNAAQNVAAYNQGIKIGVAYNF